MASQSRVPLGSPLCPWLRRRQGDRSGAGGIKDRRITSLSAGRFPDLPSLGQDLVTHSPSTLCFLFMAWITDLAAYWHDNPSEACPFSRGHWDQVCWAQNGTQHTEMPPNPRSVNECADGWADGQKDGRADGRMDGQTAVEPGSEMGGQRIEREEYKLKSLRENVKEKVSMCSGRVGSRSAATAFRAELPEE